MVSANISSQSMVQWQGRLHEWCIELGVSMTWPDTLPNMCTCMSTIYLYCANSVYLYLHLYWVSTGEVLCVHLKHKSCMYMYAHVHAQHTLGGSNV